MSEMRRPHVPQSCEFDRRRHLCGCLTVFDLCRWSSFALERCEYHAALDPAWSGVR